MVQKLASRCCNILSLSSIKSLMAGSLGSASGSCMVLVNEISVKLRALPRTDFAALVSTITKLVP